MTTVIITVIFGIIAIACFVYSIFAFQEKGPILTNEYLLATDAERKKLAGQSAAKKKRDYRFVAIVFLWLSALFLSACIGFIFSYYDILGSLMTIITCVLIVTLLIFVLVTAIKDGEFK